MGTLAMLYYGKAINTNKNIYISHVAVMQKVHPIRTNAWFDLNAVHCVGS